MYVFWTHFRWNWCKKCNGCLSVQFWCEKWRRADRRRTFPYVMLRIWSDRGICDRCDRTHYLACTHHGAICISWHAKRWAQGVWVCQNQQWTSQRTCWNAKRRAWAAGTAAQNGQKGWGRCHWYKADSGYAAETFPGYQWDSAGRYDRFAGDQRGKTCHTDCRKYDIKYNTICIFRWGIRCNGTGADSKNRVVCGRGGAGIVPNPDGRTESFTDSCRGSTVCYTWTPWSGDGIWNGAGGRGDSIWGRNGYYTVIWGRFRIWAAAGRNCWRCAAGAAWNSSTDERYG